MPTSGKAQKRVSVGATTTDGMTQPMAEVVHTAAGNYRGKRVGLETKRHPESGNSLSAYHHLKEAGDGFA